MTSSRLLIAMAEPAVILKVCGRANFSLSVCFKTLVNELRQRGYTRFVLDLTDCLIMDSTFVGVLASLTIKRTQSRNEIEKPAIQLLNPNERITNLLDDLGVVDMLQVAKGPSSNTPFTEQEIGASSREALACASLEGHRTLTEINPANIAKFKDVMEFLAEDLQRLRSKS